MPAPVRPEDLLLDDEASAEINGTVLCLLMSAVEL
jgi:hypothetical protein